MRVVLRFRTATLVKILLCFVLGVGLVCAGVWFYFYVRFSHLVDKALRDPPWRNSPTIYSAPGVLFPGQAVSPEVLARILQKHGYRPSSDLGRPPAYSVSPDGRSFSLDSGPDAAALGSTGPGRARVVFGEGGIAAIFALDGGRPLPVLHFRPSVLSGALPGNRRPAVPFDQVPRALVNAILAAEDRRFFSHPGVDVWGVLRSLFRNVRHDRVVEGGSTLTQQMVKNFFLSPERTFARKFQEAFMAMILESRLSKRELFEIYVNHTYLGQVASRPVHGFAQAADVYCGKDIRALTLAECALLAGMIRSPNVIQPFSHPAAALARRNQVLQSMAEAGFVPPEESRAAQAEPLPGFDGGFFRDLTAPYFMDHLCEGLDLKPVPEREQAPPVLTTLNPELQRCAEMGIEEGLRAVQEAHADRFGDRGMADVQAAMVVMDPRNGDVLALCGGRDFRVSQFNRAVAGRRQAGSILKPFLYALFLDTGREDPSLGLAPDSVVEDRPVSVTYGRRTYTPRNYRDIYLGPVTMRKALSHSLNAATVLYAQRAGFPRLAAGIDRLGFRARAVPYPSIALGTLDVTPLEVAAAYTAFYNGGRPLAARVLRGTRGGTPLGEGAVFSRASALAVMDMLRDTVEEGTARQLRTLGVTLPMAAKTGTAKDGWFVGLTGNLIVCCWVGYDDNREFPLSGGQSALHLFAAFLRQAARVYPVTALTPPAGPPPVTGASAPPAVTAPPAPSD